MSVFLLCYWSLKDQQVQSKSISWPVACESWQCKWQRWTSLDQAAAPGLLHCWWRHVSYCWWSCSLISSTLQVAVTWLCDCLVRKMKKQTNNNTNQAKNPNQTKSPKSPKPTNKKPKQTKALGNGLAELISEVIQLKYTWSRVTWFLACEEYPFCIIK